MMIEKMEPRQSDFCQLVGLLTLYLEKHPEDGTARIREFLTDETGLWDTAHVMEYTGWGRTHVQRLVSEGKIPYIPGKPNKFIPAATKKALEELQTGGVYGRRKSKTTRRLTP